MKILTFQARRFWWKAFSNTLDPNEALPCEARPNEALPCEARPNEALPNEALPNEPPPSEAAPLEGEVTDAVVAFLHVEAADVDDRGGVLRKTLKHIKWIANKRELRTIVLHSFTHLGGDNSAPEFARGLFDDLVTRLEATDYTVKTTPFGYFCEWELGVYGESLAKVWKQV